MEWIEKRATSPVFEVDELDLESLERGQFHRLSLRLIEDGAGRAIRVPVIVARGAEAGQVMGITAAIHGNELNGIPTIHRLMQTMDPARLRGTVVGVTIMNMPGYQANQRDYVDGQDLNRLFPGKPDGNESQVYAWQLVHKILIHFNYLIDLHTASFGRVNSLYIRANMHREVAARMARKVGAEIIVHNPGGDGTFRGEASARGIRSITVEIGDPQVFDRGMIRASRIGVRDVLEELGFLDPDGEAATRVAIECSRSFWLYTDTGGLLTVHPELAQLVARGEVIATMVNPWGEVVRVYHAPQDAIVVGKSTNPVARAGARIIHLGVVGAPPGGEAG